jgi:hypothetical protein
MLCTAKLLLVLLVTIFDFRAATNKNVGEGTTIIGEGMVRVRPLPLVPLLMMIFLVRPRIA